jgi:large subunit ribosomal protein L25
MIELDHNALFFALKREAFHSAILEMELGGKTEQVLLRDYSMHAYRPMVMHVDFQRVDATTRVTKKVPLHFVNEDIAPAVKTEGCLINHVVNELMIQCLASQLPEFLTIDLGHLATRGQTLTVNDLKLAEGIKVVTHGKPNPVIASVTAPVAEEAAPEEAAVAVVAAPVAAVPAAAPAKSKAPAKDKEKANKK